MQTDYSRVFAWAIDFCRAMNERPRIIRLLFRLVCGRYAYREFIGMQDELARQGFYPWLPYDGIRDCAYQADPVPSDLGKEREPLPLEAAAQ